MVAAIRILSWLKQASQQTGGPMSNIQPNEAMGYNSVRVRGSQYFSRQSFLILGQFPIVSTSAAHNFPPLSSDFLILPDHNAMAVTISGL
jgi:hypothetical protein